MTRQAPYSIGILASVAGLDHMVTGVVESSTAALFQVIMASIMVVTIMASTEVEVGMVVADSTVVDMAEVMADIDEFSYGCPNCTK